MPSLKSLKMRIRSVRNTRKITSAMKMVAASKLRRAQDQAEQGKPYADRMARMVASLAAGVKGRDAPPLLAGNGRDQTHLLLVVTADRGLAGGFNANAYRFARRQVQELQAAGKTVKIFTIGRKGYDLLRRDYRDLIIGQVTDYARRRVDFSTAREIMEKLTDLFATGQIDVATLVYNEFVSVILQRPTARQILPLVAEAAPAAEPAGKGAEAPPAAAGGAYDFEPSEAEILDRLLPLNLSVQIYRAMLESAAGEQAARMTAMDNATRNAGQMIKKLTLVYNRTRQAYITKELIEIISGAEAV